MQPSAYAAESRATASSRIADATAITTKNSKDSKIRGSRGIRVIKAKAKGKILEGKRVEKEVNSISTTNSANTANLREEKEVNTANTANTANSKAEKEVNTSIYSTEEVREKKADNGATIEPDSKQRSRERSRKF